MVAGGEGRTAAHLLGLKAAAAMTAEGVTFPVDLVKTRLQLQQGARAPGALSMVRAVWNSGGPLAFYKGATPAIVRHIPYSTTRIAVYEVLREYTLGGQPAGGAGGELSLGSRLFFGATAGAVGQLIAVPADVVKVKMQGDTAGKYKGFVDASVKTCREEGHLLDPRGVRRLLRPVRDHLLLPGRRGEEPDDEYAPRGRRGAALPELPRLPDQDRPGRGLHGPLQRVLPHVDAHGAVAAGVLGLLRAAPAPLRLRRLLALGRGGVGGRDYILLLILSDVGQ